MSDGESCAHPLAAGDGDSTDVLEPGALAACVLGPAEGCGDSAALQAARVVMRATTTIELGRDTAPAYESPSLRVPDLDPR